MNKHVIYKFGSFVAVVAVLLSPVIASAAVSEGSTTVNASVSSTITLATSSTVAIGLQPTTGAVVSSASDTVTVATNSANGYNLKLSDSDAVTTLANGGNTIPAHTGTLAAPTTLANNSWGYRIVGQGGFTSTAYTAESNAASSTSTWAGIAPLASPVIVKTTASTTASDPTVVWYGVKVDASKPSGVYTGTVTYTATTNS